jgi:dipeptidyl aminopeptidase/acylaminoacyl peptidase
MATLRKRPAYQPRGGYRFEQFTAVRRTLDLVFSPDGKEVAYITNTSGQFNVWKQAVKGGWPWQLTAFEENAARTVAWSPAGESLLIAADRHGDEFHQIYRLSIAGGWPDVLTSADKVQHNFSSDGWSKDGRYLAYACNGRNPADMDVMLLDLETNEHTMLLGGGANYFPASWSPDGKQLLIVKFNSNTDQDIFLFDVEAKGAKHLTPHEGQIVHSPGAWSPDGSGFYLVTDAGREFKGLVFYNLVKGAYKWIETPEWDIEDGALSEDGHLLAWTVNEDGYSRLFVKDVRTGEPLELPQLPRGVISGVKFSPDGRRLGFYINHPKHINDLYLLELEKGKLTRLTYNMLGGLSEEALIEPELVRFQSFDGRKIPAFLYKPRGASPSEKVPAVLSIHGGPESQERPVYAYSGFYQYLLNRGIAVLATNIRGSTGYGKSYQKLIHRDFGGNDLQDFKAAADYLRSLDWVDGKRLGVFGGSYGGFATLSCATRLPDYWAAAVDIVGPSNLVTFAKAVPPFWKRMMKEWVGDPDEDRDFLMQRSPITYVDQLNCPILIIQGANDPRVVKNESDQMVARLKSLGRTVEYVVFDDEGHGFTKRANELKAWRATADFLEKHLLG